MRSDGAQWAHASAVLSKKALVLREALCFDGEHDGVGRT